MRDESLQRAKDAFNSGDFKGCITHCLNSITLNVENILAWQLCALSCENLGLKQRAISYFEYIYEIAKTNGFKESLKNKLIFDSLLSLAELYRRSSFFDKSLELFTSLLPSTNGNLHYNLARLYSDLNMEESSIKHYEIALELNPNDLDAMFNLANKKFNLDLMPECIKLYKDAYSRGHIKAGINLANALINIDDLSSANSVFESLSSEVKDDFDFYFNYASFLSYKNKLDLAKKYYLYALSLNLDPAYILNLAYLLLRQKDYVEGFRLYENRFHLVENKPKDYRLKEGVTLKNLKDKKIAIVHEQGFGDSIMFARFLYHFIDYDVCLVVPEALLELFSLLPFKVSNNLDLIQSCDISIAFPSLAYICNISSKKHLQDSLSWLKSCFLQGLQELRPNLAKDSKKQKVGLNFTSNLQSTLALQKSIKQEALLKAICTKQLLSSFTYFSLQYEGLDKDYEGVIDLKENIKGFLDSAKYLLELDYLITIDSALAHLSATLGVKTILLLHKRYDWRYGKLGYKFKAGCEFYGDNLMFLAQDSLNDWNLVLNNLQKTLLFLKDNKDESFLRLKDILKKGGN